MKFQVPQFIEIEDRIFGPLTLKQFIYLVGAGGLTVTLYFLIPNFFIFFLLSAPVVALAVALSFFEINRRPFIYTLEAAVKHFSRSKLYIWQRTGSGLKTPHQVQPTQNENKLRELNLSLETKPVDESEEGKETDHQPTSHRPAVEAESPEHSSEENLADKEEKVS